MLEAIIVILIILWALGYFGGFAVSLGVGNLIHVLLVIALVVIVIRLVQGKRPIP